MKKITDPEVLLSNYQDVCDWLKASRESQKIGIRTFAKHLGVSPSFVVKTEDYSRRLSISEYIHVCEALNLDPISGITMLTNTKRRSRRS